MRKRWNRIKKYEYEEGQKRLTFALKTVFFFVIICCLAASVVKGEKVERKVAKFELCSGVSLRERRPEVSGKSEIRRKG